MWALEAWGLGQGPACPGLWVVLVDVLRAQLDAETRMGGRCRRRHTAWHILPERGLSDCGVSAPPGGGGNACVSTSHPISFLRQREVLGADASTVRSTQRCPHIFGPRFADWPHGAPCPSGLTTGTQRCSCTGRALHNGARSRGRLHGRCRFVCFPAGFREMAATCLVLTETDW